MINIITVITVYFDILLSCIIIERIT